MSGFENPSSRVARQRRQVVFRVCVCVYACVSDWAPTGLGGIRVIKFWGTVCMESGVWGAQVSFGASCSVLWILQVPYHYIVSFGIF